MKKSIILAATLSATLSACGGGGGSSDNASATNNSQQAPVSSATTPPAVQDTANCPVASDYKIQLGQGSMISGATLKVGPLSVKTSSSTVSLTICAGPRANALAQAGQTQLSSTYEVKVLRNDGKADFDGLSNITLSLPVSTSSYAAGTTLAYASQHTTIIAASPLNAPVAGLAAVDTSALAGAADGNGLFTTPQTVNIVASNLTAGGQFAVVQQ